MQAKKRSKVKKVKEPLPKNFWEVVENNLPNYFHRDDVAECNDLSAKEENGELTATEARRLDTLNRKFYREACRAAAMIG